MQTQPVFEKCLPFINSEASRVARLAPIEKPRNRPLTITISRQSGSGAQCVAQCLARYLQVRTPADAPAWMVFDRNLVEKVLEEHHLPARVARFMPEDRVGEFGDAFDELLGLHPPAWDLVRQTTETIVRLAHRGNAILMGRGAHIVTSKLDYVFHVRLVGSLEKRVEHMREMHAVSREVAMGLIRHEDRGRERYLKKYFGKDLHDPVSYHLILNTDSVPYESAARLIGEAATDHHQRQMKIRGEAKSQAQSAAFFDL